MLFIMSYSFQLESYYFVANNLLPGFILLQNRSPSTSPHSVIKLPVLSALFVATSMAWVANVFAKLIVRT